MRVVYCISNIENSGGMERITIDKANYLCEIPNYEVIIITTDLNERNSFYPLNKKIKQIDLGINYYQDYNKNLIKRLFGYYKKNRLHKNILKEKLNEIKPDITISVGTDEKNFLPFLKDGSKKIREFHFAKNYRIDNAIACKKNNILKLKAVIETYLEKIYLKKYDKVVVLTYEDLARWNLKNIEVIYNFASLENKELAILDNKKAITVGRLHPEKGYDELIDIWKEVNKKNPDWILEIYGTGKEELSLSSRIEKNKLDDKVFLKGSSKEIEKKYLESSFFVMTSRTEGLPLVLLESMGCGLPVVSFSCPSGPKEIIDEGKTGFLVENRSKEDFINKINFLIENKKSRKKMGENAKCQVELKFSKEKIMEQWIDLFKKIKSKEEK